MQDPERGALPASAPNIPIFSASRKQVVQVSGQYLRHLSPQKKRIPHS